MSEEATPFEAFWAAYPRKVGKKDAEKAWKQVQKARPSPEDLAEAIKTLQATLWRGRDANYLPYPATWLRAHGWEDARTAPQGGSPFSEQPTPLEDGARWVRHLATTWLAEHRPDLELDLTSKDPTKVIADFEAGAGVKFFGNAVAK